VYLHRRRVLSNRQMRDLGFEPPAQVPLPDAVEGDPVASVARFEFSTYLRNMLLRDSDSASMANSLELRVPMLGRPMLDLMYSVPGRELLPDGKNTKHLERLAFSDLLRKEITGQPKKGFFLPINAWLRGPLRDDARHAFESLRKAGVVRPRGVESVWRTYLNEPQSGAWSRAWALIVLGSFLSRHS
jgi:asparagine synthase (glutamine-hydrolysing)